VGGRVGVCAAEEEEEEEEKGSGKLNKRIRCRDQSRRRNEYREEHIYYCVADLEMEVALS
jgi:hypothetical protein